jgi:hypothetical protein
MVDLGGRVLEGAAIRATGPGPGPSVLAAIRVRRRCRASPWRRWTGTGRRSRWICRSRIRAARSSSCPPGTCYLHTDRPHPWRARCKRTWPPGPATCRLSRTCTRLHSRCRPRSCNRRRPRRRDWRLRAHSTGILRMNPERTTYRLRAERRSRRWRRLPPSHPGPRRRLLRPRPGRRRRSNRIPRSPPRAVSRRGDRGLCAPGSSCASTAQEQSSGPTSDASASGDDGAAVVCPASESTGPCPVEGQQCSYGCTGCTCQSGFWYCTAPGCAGGCGGGVGPPPSEGEACGGCCGPSYGETCTFACVGDDAGTVSATCESSGWHVSSPCGASSADGGLDAQTEGG